MVWTLFHQQQQRGAQIQPLPGSRGNKVRQPGADAEQALREAGMAQAAGELDEAGWLDRNH